MIQGNPIIRRELIGLLRTPQALAVQVIFVAALAVLVILRWPSEAQVDMSGQQAQQVLRMFGYGMMTAVILLAPIFPATTLVLERQRGTLALLLNSPMDRWAILAGKFLGVVGFVLLLLLLSMPAAAACYAMGGIDLRGQLLPLYGILALMAVQFAAIGLLVSSFATSTDSALRVTYGVILVFVVVGLGPHQFLQGELGGAAATILDWSRCVSPIPAMMETLGDTTVGAQGLDSSAGLSTTVKYAVLAVVTIVVTIAWLGRRLHQTLLDRPRAQGRITDDRSAGVQLYRRIMFLYFFDPQRRSGLIQPGINPVMVKEFRCRRFGRGNWMMRMIGACFILSLGLMLAAAQGTMEKGVETLGGIMVLLQFGLIVLVTPSLASGLISGERESGGWELLQQTPLSAGSIVSGKLISVAWTLFLILIATIPGYGVMLVIDETKRVTVTQVLIVLLLTAVFATLLSAAVSSMFKRTAPATVTSYAILVLLCAGTMLFWLGRDAPFTHGVVESALTVNPLAAGLSLIGAPGFEDYNLTPGIWWFMGGASAVSLLVLCVQVWRLSRPQ